MHLDAVRRHCLSFPHATETVQWGSDLVFSKLTKRMQAELGGKGN